MLDTVKNIIQKIRYWYFSLVLSFVIGLSNVFREEQESAFQKVQGLVWEWKEFEPSTHAGKDSIFINIHLVTLAEELANEEISNV